MHWSHRFVRTVSFQLILFSYLVGTALAGQGFVASVSKVSGGVIITRGSETIAAEKNIRLKAKDVLSTEADGTIGIVFNDETTLSLGPGSKLIIQEYAFDPDHSSFSFVVRLLRGTAAYVSGLIAKISPDATRFITPSASIGVRGTRFVIEVDAI